MSKRGTGLAGKLLALAEKHRGRVVSISEATVAIFNGSGDDAARQRVYHAVYALKAAGRLRGGKGGFALPAPIVPVKLTADEQLAAVAPRPAGRTAVAVTLNKLALLRNAYDQAFDDLLSEARHAIRASESTYRDIDGPAGFPMRCGWLDERDD